MSGHFFIVGPERCGTTLLRLMMDMHPAIACVGEFDFAVDILKERGSIPAPVECPEAFETNRMFRAYGVQPDSSTPYWDQVRAFLEEAAGDVIWMGATVHHSYRELLAQWPSAKLIFLVRDPRDVAPSVIKMGWAGNAWMASSSWEEAVREWQALKPKLATDQAMEVRFEDLVSKPESTLEEICRFLGQSYAPRMLEYPQHSTYPAPDPEVAFRWRRNGPTASDRWVEARTRSWLPNFGYEEDGAGKQPGALQKGFFWIQDKGYRIRFRIQRYGLSLFLRERLAVRLGLRGAAKPLTRRLQEIDETYLR